MALVEFRKRGFYIKQADCYVDPSRKVERAIVTHGHSDHATRGCGIYYSTPLTAAILRFRYNAKVCEEFEFGETFELNGVQFSFHPAGHIPGSAQVRIEYKGEVWVITGDYKRACDNLCRTFEVVPCDHFVTECTFGLPIYQWKPEHQLSNEIKEWWQTNQRLGIPSVLLGYSLGKAQRLLHIIKELPGSLYCHPTVDDINEVLKDAGAPIREVSVFDGIVRPDDIQSAMIIAPPSAIRSPWIEMLGRFSSATASGWNMTSRRRQAGMDAHFIVSDHADWPELIQTVKETGAENIYVMHGFTEVFGQHLKDLGYIVDSIEHRNNA